MSCPLNEDDINKLKKFISLVSANPQLLNIPDLEFLKTFIEKLGGKVPIGPKCFQTDDKPEAAKPQKQNEEIIEEDEPESDIELDMAGVIEGDSELPQDMGDVNKIPTEADMEEASLIRSKAAFAFSEQKYSDAIELYTKAIQSNPTNALYYAKRGQAFLKLQKPNACIRDCNRALELNSDSAAAYKFRGRAHRLLGKWELAACDLRQACKLDFDEELDEWLREVTPNAKKIEQQKIKQERKKAERELREREERMKRAQEANKKAEEKNEQSAGSGNTRPPGGMPNFGGAFNDNELFNAFKDKDVADALQDIMKNPSNITKYMSNPKIMNLMAKISSTMGSGGGMGFPGFPGAGNADEAKKSSSSDDYLD